MDEGLRHVSVGHADGPTRDVEGVRLAARGPDPIRPTERPFYCTAPVQGKRVAVSGRVAWSGRVEWSGSVAWSGRIAGTGGGAAFGA